MWDSDSDDGFAAGGLSMQDFARKNAETVQKALLALEEKLYNEVVDDEEGEEEAGPGDGSSGAASLGGEGDGAGEVGRAPPGFGMDGDYLRGGWAPAPPPPSPHLEWQHFPHLRVRGTAMVLHRGGAPGGEGRNMGVGEDPLAAAAAASSSSTSSTSSSSPRSAPPPTPTMEEDMQRSQCPRPYSAEAPAPGQEYVDEIIAIDGTLGELQD